VRVHRTIRPCLQHRFGRADEVIAPAINDLLGGHLSMAFSGLPPTIGHVEDGKLRASAVTGSWRDELGAIISRPQHLSKRNWSAVSGSYVSCQLRKCS
jgi:hypothetical protein